MRQSLANTARKAELYLACAWRQMTLQRYLENAISLLPIIGAMELCGKASKSLPVPLRLAMLRQRSLWIVRITVF